MKHEIFRMETFAKMEEYIGENPEKEFTLTGVDLAVLIFLTRCITCSEIHKELTSAVDAGIQADQIISRLQKTQVGPVDPKQTRH